MLSPQRTKIVTALLQAFKSLPTPDFRTLWFGMLFNVASMQVNIVARSWLAYDLSGSALVLVDSFLNTVNYILRGSPV